MIYQPHLWASAAILGFSALALLYALFAFAHSRITSADMIELERLHADGLLSPTESVVEDFESIRARLNRIAPAIYLRQEPWVRLYFAVLRLAAWCSGRPRLIEDELRRLTAYQAIHYREALARYAAIH